MTQLVKADALLTALGVVPSAEPDSHLANRMKRLAKRVEKHFASNCTRCRSHDGNSTFGYKVWMCDDMIKLVEALTRAAAQGQRYADTSD